MAKYKLNYEELGRQVLASAAMKANMKARAEAVKATFEATAPVGPPYEDDEHAGRYKNSARTESGVRDTGRGRFRGPRAYGRVVVDDPAAMPIEFGHTTSNGTHVDGSFTLTRALDAAGD